MRRRQVVPRVSPLLSSSATLASLMLVDVRVWLPTVGHCVTTLLLGG